MRGACAEHWHTDFRFSDDELVVQATSGTISQQGRPFNHGFEIHLEKATLLFEFAVIGGEGRYLVPPTLLNSKGKAKLAKMPDGDPMMNAFVKELKEVAKGVKSGNSSPILAAPLARDAITICNKQTASLKSGRSVRL